MSAPGRPGLEPRRGRRSRRRCAALVALSAVALFAGCEREQRELSQPPSTATALKSATMNDLVTGGGSPLSNPYEKNAQALADGKRLFAWYNCNGCHANGGGDKGPALMDDEWLYGSEPANVVASILQGRPNGMPAFAGRIPDYQAWQIAAYVRSMSGLVPQDAAPGRDDAMSAKPSENRVQPQPQHPVNVPQR